MDEVSITNCIQSTGNTSIFDKFSVYFTLELKCLQTILQDHSKAMEEDCRLKLQRRIEMFRNADTVCIHVKDKHCKK